MQAQDLWEHLQQRLNDVVVKTVQASQSLENCGPQLCLQAQRELHRQLEVKIALLHAFWPVFMLVCMDAGLDSPESPWSKIAIIKYHQSSSLIHWFGHFHLPFPLRMLPCHANILQGLAFNVISFDICMTLIFKYLFLVGLAWFTLLEADSS